MLRTYLIRHGEAVGNHEGRYIGTTDTPLTDTGERQAEAVAGACAEVPLEVIFTSPLQRARSTADHIAQRCAVELRVVEDLTEMHFGRWEGLTPDEIRSLGEDDRRLLASWHADPSAAPPGGEALTAVAERCLAFIDRCHDHGLGSIAVVSHVGGIKALLCSALGLPLGASSRTFLDPATITVIDWGARPVLRLFNSHAHLGWSSARWMQPSLD
jgi:probable phosphoglycerate mutase